MKAYKTCFSVLIIILFILPASFAQDKMLWGDEVPRGWNGEWPDELRTACELSDFTYTADNDDILEYFETLMWNSEHVSVFDMFVSDRGRTCPVLVMANPRVTNAREARESKKTIVYLQGGIHPSECEGKEAMLMLTRDILLGDKNYLLDSLIILFTPNFNVDGNETRNISRGNPIISGTRHNAMDLDVNRDAIKVETTNMIGAYENVFNTWDPVLIYDTHRMGNARHGYPIVYAGSNVATAHAGPRDYVTYDIFPSMTERGRENGNIEIFYHCGLPRDEWPPGEFTHDNAIWSTEAKFMVSGYGLRNRMAILTETVGYMSLEKMVYSQYVFADELLQYAYEHGREMQEVCRQADQEVVRRIKEDAPSGNLMNYIEGAYVSEGKVDILAYEELSYDYIPGTSVRKVEPVSDDGRPELVRGVELVTKPVGTSQARVPRGYIIPRELSFIVDKLRILGLEVTRLEEPLIVTGEQFVIDEMIHERSTDWPGYIMTELDGGFMDVEDKYIPAGSYHLDMAQALANVAFYALEPEVGDGFVGWSLLDDYFVAMGVYERSIVYPVFKYFTSSPLSN